MSIASPRNDKEREIADALNGGFDAGWQEAFDAAIQIVANHQSKGVQPIIEELIACKEGRSLTGR